MKKIAFVLNTTGLEYDDRVRKEALTLSEIAQVKIIRSPKGLRPMEYPINHFG